ncbi:hypothetical protein I6Y99_004388 [Vibrio parahaemolyticus]|nr:hypothetical protein [Vibrio parahaemolyticus]
MSHSIIRANGITVEVKGQSVFIDGRLVTKDQMKQAMHGKIFGMVCLIVGWLAGAFSAFVILPMFQ